MSYILDASVTLAWCFSDEATPETVTLLNRLESEIAFVPTLWSLEVGNILVNAERYKRITYAQISEFITLLGSINIRVDTETATRGFHEIIILAHAEKLTTYDAAYLELAMRLGLPLATKDKQMRQVATRLGLELINI